MILLCQSIIFMFSMLYSYIFRLGYAICKKRWQTSSLLFWNLQDSIKETNWNISFTCQLENKSNLQNPNSKRGELIFFSILLLND